MDPTEEGSSPSTNETVPTMTTEEKCYLTSENDRFCISTTSFGGGLEICTASMNRRFCRSCSTSPCLENQTVGKAQDFQPGYKLDCSTGNSWTNDGIMLCGNVAIYGNNLPPYTNQNTYHGGSRTSRSTRHFTAVPVYFIALLVAIVFRIVRLAARIERRSQTGYQSVLQQQQQHRRGQPTQGHNIDVELSAISGGVRASEVLVDDSAEDFFFYKPRADDPRAVQLRQSVVTRDWKSITEELTSLRTPRNDTAQNSPGIRDTVRHFYCQIVVNKIAEDWTNSLTSSPDQLSPLLGDWVAGEPDSVDCRIIRMEASIKWAWKARTGMIARLVSPEQNAAFQVRIQQAARDLDHVLTLGDQAQNDPLVLASQVTIAKALGGVDVRSLLIRFEETPDNQWHFVLYVRALQYFCDKWHGSHQQMFALARSITAHLPIGHPLWILIIHAHYEFAITQESASRYWRQASVKNEILNAYKHAFYPQQEAVWQFREKTHPAGHVLERQVRTWFLYGLFLSGSYEESRRQARLVGKRPTSGVPLTTMNRYRMILVIVGFETESLPSATVLV